MNYEDRIVCPQCNKINPINCEEAICPIENFFWEEDD